MNFTIFGVTETEISGSGFTSLTMFGGTELRRQTLAERIMNLSKTAGRKPSAWEKLAGTDRPTVITLFGITTIVSPTIIEEYSAVRNLLNSGAITKEECMAMVASISNGNADKEITTVTLFGGCGFETVNEKKQRKALELAEKAGSITPTVKEELAQAIGCPDRTAVSIVARVAMA